MKADVPTSQRRLFSALAAYEMLLAKLDFDVARANEAAARPFRAESDVLAEELLPRVQQLAAPREDLLAWADKLLSARDPERPSAQVCLQGRSWTPMDAFRVAILRTVVMTGKPATRATLPIRSTN